MKKLLSILTISTLTANIPAPLLANTVQTRVKRDIGINEKDITDGMQIQMSNIKDLSELNWTNLITNRNKRNVNSQNTPILKTDGADKPTEQQIKDRLKEKNNKLDITKINVTKITENSATIISNDKNFYSGEITINFKVDKSINLNRIIKTTDLGEFITSNLSKPTEWQLKNKLKLKNPQLDIIKIWVNNVTENSATIISNDNNIYSGDPINVNYTISISSLNWE